MATYPSLQDRINNIENSEEMKTIHQMYQNTTDNGLKADLRANAERLRNNAGYMSDATGSNYSEVPGDTRSSIIETDPQEDPTKKMIDEMKAAQKQARYAALDKQYQASQSALNSEQSAIAPQYYNKRNQAAGQSDLAALNFAQRAAARGIKGNGGTMPEIYRNAALQGQIGALDQQEAAANADIERRRSGLTSSYEADKSAADADIEAQAMQNYINQMNANRQYDLALGEQTGTINGQDTLEKQQFDYNKTSTNPTVYAQILANKKQELENKAQEIQNSYLPETLKLQAQRLAQQVQAGSLDYDTALAQLNKIRSSGSSSVKSSSSYTPTDVIDKLAQMKNATIETGKTGNASGLMTTYAPKYTTDDLMKYLYQQGISPADAEGYLSQIGVSL